jgi:hypothetical protein
VLDEWWARIADRLDSGPAALHRLPEPVAHVAAWQTSLSVIVH